MSDGRSAAEIGVIYTIYILGGPIIAITQGNAENTALVWSSMLGIYSSKLVLECRRIPRELLGFSLCQNHEKVWI